MRRALSNASLQLAAFHQMFRRWTPSTPNRPLKSAPSTRPRIAGYDVAEQPAEISTCLPSGVRIYAIGDLHGRADLLRAMLDKLRVDQTLRPVERSIILFLGDYVDRGPSSKEVLDVLLEYASQNES